MGHNLWNTYLRTNIFKVYFIWDNGRLTEFFEYKNSPFLGEALADVFQAYEELKTFHQIKKLLKIQEIVKLLAANF